MSQEAVLKKLENRDYATIEQLADELNMSIPAVWHNLKMLVKTSHVECVKISKDEIDKYNLPKRGRYHVIWRAIKIKAKPKRRETRIKRIKR